MTIWPLLEIMKAAGDKYTHTYGLLHDWSADENVLVNNLLVNKLLVGFGLLFCESSDTVLC